jgi:hypothetical protein
MGPSQSLFMMYRLPSPSVGSSVSVASNSGGKEVAR